MSRRVAVVAHTHWDREWYAPLEAYRARLVTVMDGLIDLLETDPAFRHFLLDGQMALVDDYLSVRPEQRDRLQRLAGAGRVSAGPWYVLMDEFCVSGETIWRNLQLGLAKARSFGLSSFVGYLPDMFGHVAQMPQILATAGLDQAVVWRGVPDAVERAAFWWCGPDGSRVRAEYLPVGYANGAFLPKAPEDLVRRVEAHETEIGALLPEGWPLLLMNGGDHQAAQAWLPQLVESANRVQDRYLFEQVSLAEHLAKAPTTGLADWVGELRSSARANLLLGVASNRVDVKKAAAGAERSLERMAEPLAVLWLPPDMWPAAELDEAWLGVIRNSAHDSICACSVDAVGRAVLARYDTALAIAADVVGRATAIAEVATTGAGTIVVNPSPHDRSGLVEITVAGTELPPGTQLVTASPAGRRSVSGVGADLARLLGSLPPGPFTDATLSTGDGGVVVTLVQDGSVSPRPEMAAVMAEAWANAGARRHDPLTVRVEQAATVRVLARAPSVPGYGWAMWSPAGVDTHRVTCGPDWVDNGLVRLTLGADGTFGLAGTRGLNRIEEQGDEGDTYTFSPIGPVLDRPVEASVEQLEPGPLRAVWRTRRRFEWPSHLAGGERVGREPVEVVSDVEVRAGDPLVRVTTSFDNRGCDHRVRAVFPLPAPAVHSVAECAFGTVRRPAAGYGGGPHEVGVPTFPSRRFVQAGGLTLVHDGLLEYELVDDGRALAVTLLRAVGVLSRPAPPYRPNAAGPAEPVPDAQLPGPHTFRYAVAIGDVDPWRLADEAWTPLLTGRSTGTGRLAPSGSRLSVSGGQVSALRRVAGRIELRVFNPSEQPAVVGVPGHSGALVDLEGRQVGRWADWFELGPWAIATAWLDALTLD